MISRGCSPLQSAARLLRWIDFRVRRDIFSLPLDDAMQEASYYDMAWRCAAMRGEERDTR